MEVIKNKSPLVSIIIPTYNRAKLISGTMDSIITQTYQYWECIIVDDGSNDNTSDVVQEYVEKDNRFKFYHRPEKYKPGANGARNFGFDMSKGEYIQWFDSDDFMLEYFLSDKIDAFNKNPEYHSVICRITFFEGDKIQKNQYSWDNMNDSLSLYENYMFWFMPIMTPCILFRKEYLLAIGEKWDETVKRSQEFEFFIRIFIKHSHKTFFIDKSLALIRRNNADAITTLFDGGNSLEMNNAYYVVQDKLIELLMYHNKLKNHHIAIFYKDHKELLSVAYKRSQYKIAQNYKNLIEKYLIYKNDKFDLAKFRLGYFLMKLIPIDNLFLNYNYNSTIHVFNRYVSGNIKRIYKLLFVKGWLLGKLKV